MSALPAAEPFTYDDLQAFPDDGYRRELIDGQLIVSPSPIRLHQRCVARLMLLLGNAVPPELEVLPGPVVSAYETAGVACSWLVDPEGPSLTAVELRDGRYGEPVTVTGNQAWTAERPFPVEVVPARLVAPGR